MIKIARKIIFLLVLARTKGLGHIVLPRCKASRRNGARYEIIPECKNIKFLCNKTILVVKKNFFHSFPEKYCFLKGEKG